MDKIKNGIRTVIQKLQSFWAVLRGGLKEIWLKMWKPFKKNRKVKFKKVDKKLVQVYPKRISQSMANKLFMGFVMILVIVSSLTILSNGLRALRAKDSRSSEPVISDHSKEMSNQVNLFMTDFLSAYFANSDELVKYYGPGIDVKQMDTKPVDTRLLNLTVVEITAQVASYQVEYEVQTGETWTTQLVVVNVPYKEKQGNFYVSDLPYFTSHKDYVAKKVKGKYQLKTQTEEKDYRAAKEYVEAFFKAYSSGDKTQLSPFFVSSDIEPLKGYHFEAIDYSYFIEEKRRLVAVVQVRFQDDLGLNHVENFTLFLTSDKKSKTYRVNKMEHGIVSTYRREVT